jgi:hypothetical protein
MYLLLTADTGSVNKPVYKQMPVVNTVQRPHSFTLQLRRTNYAFVTTLEDQPYVTLQNLRLTKPLEVAGNLLGK